MEKIPVAAYCRVSTDSLDQENSFENQKTYFEQEIANHEKYELYHIYKDKGLSGTSFSKRKEFLEMVYDAGVNWTRKSGGKVEFEVASDRKPKFKRILVTNLSRFSRDILAIGCIRELQKKEVFIDFLNEKKTTENESDDLLINMLILLAQQESKDKSGKVRFGHDRGAIKGVIHTTDNIYGYKYFKESNSLEIIPDEADIVKQIFELYSKGYGIRRIINILDSKGITTRKGEGFSKTSISRILQNEKYCGISVRNKYDTGVVFNKNSRTKTRPINEWIIHEDRIPAIISKELFYKCQEIRNSKVNYVQQLGINKGTSEFAGLITCGKCGHAYTRNVDRGRAYFNCGLKKTKGNIACDNTNVTEREINSFIESLRTGGYYINLIHDREEKIHEFETKKKTLLNRIDQQSVKDVEMLQSELDALNERKNTLLDLFIEGNFDKNELEIRRNKLDVNIDKITQQLNELSKTNKQIFMDIQEIEDSIKKLKELKFGTTYSRQHILNEIKRILVFKSPGNERLMLIETALFSMVCNLNQA